MLKMDTPKYENGIMKKDRGVEKWEN